MTAAATAVRGNPRVRGFLMLNVVGGSAVLASYAWGLSHLGSEASRAWGGVPLGLRPLYEVNMVLAAIGYFPMSLFVLRLLRDDPGTARLASRLYAMVLGASAAWLPLTCAYFASPSEPMWWAVRAVLFLVAASALGVLAMIVRARPSPPSAGWWAAVGGASFFCLQTAVLDALVWPAYFFAGR